MSPVDKDNDISDGHGHGHEWPQSFFSEQLVMLDGLNFAFDRPAITSLKKTNYTVGLQTQDYDSLHKMISKSLSTTAATAGTRENNKDKKKSDDDDRQRDQLLHLLRLRREKDDSPKRKVILITQTLPKLHPSFDSILLPLLLLSEDRRPVIVFLSDPKRKGQWQRTIVSRWKQTLPSFMRTNNTSVDIIDSILSHGILWVEGPLSPQRYLQLQLLGDLAIDPFPFGGGVTTLETLAVCTPVLTLPSLQTVPQLAAGMIAAIDEQESLVAASVEDMLQKAKQLLYADEQAALEMRQRICDKQDLLYHPNSQSLQDKHAVAGLDEWNRFLRRLVNKE